MSDACQRPETDFFLIPKRRVNVCMVDCNFFVFALYGH